MPLLNWMAPGPGIPPAALIDGEAVGGMQNSDAVIGLEVSFTQAPLVQSALVVHSAKSSGSSMQYEPSGDGAVLST